MNTKEAIEKLPWLVNGSLAPEEAAEVRGHLADSEECRAELKELAEAGRLFGARVPTGVLLDYVAGRDVAPYDRGTIERLINISPTGLEEWKMASESWSRVGAADAGDEPGQVVPFRPRTETVPDSGRGWRQVAIAASLLAVLGVGGWWNAARDVTPTGFNPTIVEVSAVDPGVVLRDSDQPVTLVEGSTDGPLQLSLASRAGGVRTLEILDAGSIAVWSPTQEFRADVYGEFIVGLPADLEPGTYTVQLYRGSGEAREAAEQYLIELR